MTKYKSVCSTVGAVVALSGSLGLVGCAAPPRLPPTVAVAPPHVVRFTLPASVVGSMTVTDLGREYAKALRDGTRLPLMPDGKGGRAGLDVLPQGAQVRALYRNYFAQNFGQEHFGDFMLSVQRQGDTVAVDVACPQALRTNMSYPTVSNREMTSEQIVADVQQLCTRTPLTLASPVTGEVDVPFGEAAVYANFKRKAVAGTAPPREQGEAANTMKSAWHRVKLRDGLETVGITVYPYRNGSKVTYTWLRSVRCAPGGACRWDPNDVALMNQAIATVAND